MWPTNVETCSVLTHSIPCDLITMNRKILCISLKKIMAVNEICSVSPSSIGKTTETHGLQNM